ncbi:hypothetical protein Nos7524_5684 (plasmid) [Nostoc sp. PCC 7524]|jgi:hypothetical protein|uniref:hypothetical protein n=1 Tax=Nostoc sp. (strain ATCC 29411 / PCC 7524) TaxID=28072 RepID=UPI00029F2A7A|nr:hypothetical protein [Nostoc sp. PCC 7524]AFY51371.1 hypothetical protein Nos7524_5684 [Nostoc sp. PCC 7524]
MNERLYQVSLTELTKVGVPQAIAEQASLVVANDDPTKPNLGRTPQAQEAVNAAMTHYHANQQGVSQ